MFGSDSPAAYPASLRNSETSQNSSKTDSSKEDSFDNLVKEDREFKFTIFTAWNEIDKDQFCEKVDDVELCHEDTERFSNLEGRC